MAYVRTVKTASGATAVQIVCSSQWGSREIKHIGSAHDNGELEALKAVGQATGQMELGLGLDRPGPSGPLEIASSRIGHLWDALSTASTMTARTTSVRMNRNLPAQVWPATTSPEVRMRS